MEHKPTNELNSILENTHPDQLNDFLRENSRFMADDKKGFYYYFKDKHELINYVFKRDVDSVIQQNSGRTS